MTLGHYIRDGESKDKRAKVDAHGHLFTIDEGFVHSKIHAGEMFTTGNYFAGVADTTTVTLLIRVGSIPMHGKFAISAGQQGFIDAFEGVTIGDGGEGTLLPVFNRKRNSANTPTARIYHTPTIATPGTQLFKQFLPGGTKQSATGASASGFDEMVLLADTDYSLSYTNEGGATGEASFEVNFYERNIG